MTEKHACISCVFYTRYDKTLLMVTLLILKLIVHLNYHLCYVIYCNCKIALDTLVTQILYKIMGFNFINTYLF